MNSLLLPILGMLALAFIIVFFVLRSKARRQLQKSDNEIANLKAGKAHYEFEISSNFNDAAISKITKLLAANHFRIIENVQDGLIAYSGKSEDAVLSGWLNVDPLTLPVRVVVSASPSRTIKVQFADDYGFQMLTASLKLKFNEVYQPNFKHIEALIRSEFN